MAPLMDALAMNWFILETVFIFESNKKCLNWSFFMHFIAHFARISGSDQTISELDFIHWQHLTRIDSSPSCC